jgi:hypothetical protein
MSYSAPPEHRDGWNSRFVLVKSVKYCFQKVFGEPVTGFHKLDVAGSCPNVPAGTPILLPPNIRGLGDARMLVTEVTDNRGRMASESTQNRKGDPGTVGSLEGDDERHKEVVAGGRPGPMQRMRELCSRLPARLPGSTVEFCGFAIPRRMQRRSALRAGMPAGCDPDFVGADRRKGIARRTPHVLAFSW